MQRQSLIVDDEVATCEMIQKVLASAGIEALTVTRSLEAPGFLEERKFDMVFLDLHMSSPDGIELARRARRSKFNRTTPIVLLSDDQRPSALSIGFEAGASFFLYKPIDKDRLWRLVRATQGASEQERRRTRRIPVRSRVLLSSGSKEFEAETVDISLGGMLVRAPRIIPAGSSVRFRLELAAQMKPIVGMGAVMRVTPGNHMGIQVGSMSTDDSDRLQEFLLPMIAHE
ncbi:MAG TPA: response regulator [Candidatus Acidoferrum sp.]|jgi:DNA-binding response OmpR family regulator